VDRPPGFFQGSELPRLLILAVLMVAGWALVWHFANKLPPPAEPDLVATAKPEPVVADKSVEFESVTDRTPVEFRDSAARGLLLERARSKTPDELAAIARRDVALAHIWQNPEHYRGVPIHLLGAATRVLRHESKASKTGWLYEAWIFTPETARVPYACVFEEAPPGFPIGTNISERVVFNGYFLKIMKYQASDVARGAPVLVGRIGWEPHDAASADGKNSLLHWSLIGIGIMFLVSLGRWAYQLYRLFTAPPLSPLLAARSPVEEIDTSALEDWVHSLNPADDSAANDEDSDES
jgi:hypothetical protein